MLVRDGKQGPQDAPELDLPAPLLIAAMMVAAFSGAAFGSLQSLLGG